MAETKFTSKDEKPNPIAGVAYFERGLDPWHPEAFKGTPAEGILKSDEPRKSGWSGIDWAENIICWVPDGTEITRYIDVPDTLEPIAEVIGLSTVSSD